MRSLGFLVLALAALPPAVSGTLFAQPPAMSGDRIMSWMDRNQNGQLDPEEMERMPGSFREFLSERGVRFDRPLAGDEFLRMAPEMFEAARSRRGAGRGGDDDGRGRGDWGARRGGRGDWSRRSDESGEGRSGSSSSGATTTPQPKPRVTLDLPEAYRAGDVDGDGQIGLFEWMQWKGRAAVAEFTRQDLNGDGFVTPKEIALAAARPSVAPVAVASAGVAAAPQTGAPATAPANAASSAAASAAAPQLESPQVREARSFFKLLDVDRSGSVSSDEWGRSRRLKPMFEQAGLDLSQPMSEQQFIDGYAKALAASQSQASR